MNALQDLAARLALPAVPQAPLPAPAPLVALVARLQQAQQAAPAPPPADACAQALARFTRTGAFDSLRQARLASWGLGTTAAATEPGPMQDPALLGRLLAATDAWQSTPIRYRRLYQGLLHSWFTFDPWTGPDPATRRAASLQLRTHLAARARATVDPRHNPPWVRRVVTSPHLFGDPPGAPHADALLRGDDAPMEALCGDLGISPGSWFRRELVRAQLQAAIALPHPGFMDAVPRVLAAVARQPLLRDEALRLLMERWATVQPPRPAQPALLQAARLSWGDPGLQAPDPRWLALGDAARALFAGWRSRPTLPAALDLTDAPFLPVPAAPAPPATAPADADHPSPDAHWRTAEAAGLPFSRANLAIYARAHGLTLDDRSARGEGLWVRATQVDETVCAVLARWGFTEVPGAGWKR